MHYRKFLGYQRVKQHTSDIMADKVGRPFTKGVSGNPKGRPPSIVTKLNNRLKKGGYEPLRQSQVRDTYLVVATLTQDRLEQLSEDPKAPMFARLAARELLGKNGFEAMELILDRMHGKPTQTTIVNADVKTTAVDYSKMSEQALEELNRAALGDDGE